MTIINNTAATIDTVVPQLTIGQIMLSADRRSTKEKPLTDAERIRRAVIPAGHWNHDDASIAGSKSQALTDLLREALRTVANNRLRDILAETNDGARTINLSDFTVPALLAWNAESASSRGSITFTREQATDWFNDSATAKALAAKHGPVKAGPILAFLSNRYGALAARNHGLKDAADADKLAAIIDPADTTGPQAALVTEILSRLEHISKALAARAAVDSVSMDDI